MTPNEVKWVQGTVVIDWWFPSEKMRTDLIRDSDYVLLQMMGKIKHRADGLPALRYSGWPFKH